MITYRRCPLNIAKDQHGWFLECINCGFTRDLKLLQAKDKVGATIGKA